MWGYGVLGSRYLLSLAPLSDRVRQRTKTGKQRTRNLTLLGRREPFQVALLHTSAGLCASPARHARSSLASRSILRQRSVGTTEAQTGPAQADPRPQCSAALLKSGNSAPAPAYTPFQTSATDNLYRNAA